MSETHDANPPVDLERDNDAESSCSSSYYSDEEDEGNVDNMDDVGQDAYGGNSIENGDSGQASSSTDSSDDSSSKKSFLNAGSSRLPAPGDTNEQEVVDNYHNRNKTIPQRSNIYHKIRESVTSSSKNGLLADVRQRTYEQNGTERILASFSSSSDSDDSSSTEDSSITSSDKGGHIDYPRNHTQSRKIPTAEPYVGKLERFELLSTSQCYYLVASDKGGKQYRVLKMDRTLIELPSATEDPTGGFHQHNGSPSQTPAQAQQNHNDFPPPPPPPPKNLHPGMIGETEHTQHRQPQTVPPINHTTAAPFPGVSSHGPSEDEQHNRKTSLRRLSEFCFEDPTVYTASEIQQMLNTINDGNMSSSSWTGSDNPRSTVKDGGLKPIIKAYGIVGFIRFLDCYYITLITRKSKVGSINGNGIYTIKSTETIPLKPAEQIRSSASVLDGTGNDPSSMLLNMWNRGKRSLNLGLTNRETSELRYQGLYQVVDLTKDFFFSYTYDITRSLQENVLAMSSQAFPPPPFKNMYSWNYFQTRELEEITNNLTGYHWVLPLIHGAFIQRKLHDYGRSLSLCLLSRRSRHFAGTRYLKRGVSDEGKVANDVEHEQIIHDETSFGAEGTFSSFLQVRGSIPIYWTQESSVTMPKPPIVLSRVDPTYQASQSHFEDLLKRYGSPIVVVDLVKQSEKREREVIVGNEFRHAIDYLNCHIDDNHKIRYCALDYSHISKHRKYNVRTSLRDVATWAVNQTGFFCNAPRWRITKNEKVEPFDEADTRGAEFLTRHLGVKIFPMEQKGVMRTNCIDCLDRTNVAQFSAGVEALGQQLVVMGVRSAAKLDTSSNIVKMLIEMYVEIGDHISLQYGGSEAHKKGQVTKVQGPMGKHKELLTSIRRYYSNAFTDRLKQDAMNLFLGYYIPSHHTVPLWEMENDYYLHNFNMKAGRGCMQSMKKFERSFAVAWKDDNDEKDDGKDNDSAISSSPLSQSHKILSRKNRLDNVNDESWRIERVRKRCNAQNSALSGWWRLAIQSYIQQRMWMQLGRGPNESVLPSRFERMYQPEKLSEFDKLLSQSWQKTSRVPHSAQRSSSTEDDAEFLLVNMKNASFKILADTDDCKNKNEKDERSDSMNSIFSRGDADPSASLGEYIRLHGYANIAEPHLKQFLKSHLSSRLHSSFGHNEYGFIPNESSFMEGKDLNVKFESTPLGRMNEPLHSSTCLNESFLDSDDVEGILKLAQSAHISNEIKSGPYRGLSQHESAIDVTTVIHEQFIALESMKNRGKLNEDILPGVDDELKRREMDTPGVIDAVHGGWKQFANSEGCYEEIMNVTSFGPRRSDVTDDKSMELYCSFFDKDTSLSSHEMDFIHGSRVSNKSLPNHVDSPLNTSEPASIINDDSTLMAKAKKMGFPVSKRDSTTNMSASLFLHREDRDIPTGFEQINDDLYARKDNRFIVFNGAGITQWPPKSLTKVRGIEEDILIA